MKTFALAEIAEVKHTRFGRQTPEIRNMQRVYGPTVILAVFAVRRGIEGSNRPLPMPVAAKNSMQKARLFRWPEFEWLIDQRNSQGFI